MAKGTLKFLKIENKNLENIIVIDESNYEETFQRISEKRLLEGEKSLVGQTIETLKKLQKDDKKVATFNLYIEKIIAHLEEIEG